MQISSRKDGALPSHPYASVVNWQQEHTELSIPIGSPRPKQAVDAIKQPTENYISQTARIGSLASDELQAEASRILSLLSGKWTCELLWALSDGAVRLSELRRRMPKASKKVLVDELRKLERYGLLLRTDLSRHHMKHVEYRLVDDVFIELRHILETLACWGFILKGRYVHISCCASGGYR